MAVYLSSVIGAVSLGMYSLVTDKLLILPKMFSVKKAQKMAEWLKVTLVPTSISGSVLVGALACANSNGMILNNMIREEELAVIRPAFDGNIKMMDTKKNAYGNLVLANDKGAVVAPHLNQLQIRQITETLGVEAVPGEIAGLPYVGSIAVATNKGVLAHPLLSDSERELLESTLKVPVDVGAVNCGIPYVGTGLISNSYAAVAGSMTTGPEIFIIGNALDVVAEDE